MTENQRSLCSSKNKDIILAILLFAVVISFVALAYYLDDKKICNMNLAATIRDDTWVYNCFCCNLFRG